MLADVVGLSRPPRAARCRGVCNTQGSRRPQGVALDQTDVSKQTETTDVTLLFRI